MPDEIAVNVEDEKIDDVEEKSEEVEETPEFEEEDPYEAELKRLEAERLKAEEIARQKTGALKEEREKAKALEARIAKLESKGNTVDAVALKEELRAEIRMDAEIDRLSTNPKEQELMRHYIKNNGLTPHDAWVLANKAVLVKSHERESEIGDEENALARLSGASAGGSRDTKSPLFSLASQGLTDAEKKRLKI